MAENETPQEPAKGKRPLLIIAFAIVLGVAAGGGGGIFAAKTVLAESKKAEPDSASHAAAAADSHGAAEDDHGALGNAATGPLHVVENVVLNPANSRGTRYLMVSVAFAVGDETVVESMKSREPEVRDALMGVLGAKTVSELSDIAQRDSLKTEVKEGVGKLFPGANFEHIYFPQFVIQ